MTQTQSVRPVACRTFSPVGLAEINQGAIRLFPGIIPGDRPSRAPARHAQARRDKFPFPRSHSARPCLRRVGRVRMTGCESGCQASGWFSPSCHSAGDRAAKVARHLGRIFSARSDGQRVGGLALHLAFGLIAGLGAVQDEAAIVADAPAVSLARTAWRIIIRVGADITNRSGGVGPQCGIVSWRVFAGTNPRLVEFKVKKMAPSSWR